MAALGLAVLGPTDTAPPDTSGRGVWAATSCCQLGKQGGEAEAATGTDLSRAGGVGTAAGEFGGEEDAGGDFGAGDLAEAICDAALRIANQIGEAVGVPPIER